MISVIDDNLFSEMHISFVNFLVIKVCVFHYVHLNADQVKASEPADLVLDLVREKLRRLTITPSKFSFFRIPDVLRKLN